MNMKKVWINGCSWETIVFAIYRNLEMYSVPYLKNHKICRQNVLNIKCCVFMQILFIIRKLHWRYVQRYVGLHVDWWLKLPV
jgi:hypothetical protein